MNWTEVNVYTTTEGIEPVCGRLLGVGVTGFAIKDSKDFEDFLNDKTGNWDYIDDDLMDLKNCETCVTFYLADNSQGADMLAMVRSEMAELAALDTEKKFGRLVCELSNVREEDWANNWKQYFKPLKVGDKLVVKPSWEPLEETDRTVLEIDPESSFGTGQHNTTQLCLELLEKTLHENDKVLDLGCGSGILSIAALLLGADNACAVDIDLNSVKIAGGYNLITANIVADVLIAMAPLFGDFLVPMGTVIISGIIIERCDEVMAAMEKAGFKRTELRESGGWAAASFVK